MDESMAFSPPQEPLPAISRLVLTDFRTYASLDLRLQSRIIVLTGENGAGKTNLIEAISLLSPGRGLRRAELSECARIGGPDTFAVSVEVATKDGMIQLGTGTEAQPDSTVLRRYRLNREPIASIRRFADYVRVVWLTPSTDGLFAGPAGERRRFLDRLVLALDAEHGSRVNALERALRNRNRLLEERGTQGRWLDAAEREVAELGIAVAAARNQAIAHLTSVIDATKDLASPFPFAELSIEGEIEDLTANRPALDAEEIFRRLLRNNRGRDAAAGRTLRGPHTSDLFVRHGIKQAEAAHSSTGEQKALLIGLVLAHARLVADLSGIAPFILLDEIAAHLDAARRTALYERLMALDAQVFLTGADRIAFAGLEGRATVLKVVPGKVLEA
jgi:DNA replication and repair protein RecF